MDIQTHSTKTNWELNGKKKRKKKKRIRTNHRPLNTKLNKP